MQTSRVLSIELTESFAGTVDNIPSFTRVDIKEDSRRHDGFLSKEFLRKDEPGVNRKR